MDYELVTKRLNSCRMDNPGEFSQKEIQDILREYGVPASVAYFSYYVKFGVVTRVARGIYAFPAEPIYKGIVSTALSQIRKYKCSNYEKNKQDDKQEIIYQAIQLLKGEWLLSL